MANLRERRTCPYCGFELVLGDCAIVGTNPETIGRVVSDNGRETMPSGAVVLDWVQEGSARLPVLARSPISLLDTGYSRLRSRVAPQLPPVTSSVSTEDLPARLCGRCKHPLPTGMDDRKVYTIAVVGTYHAGKSHYLASMMLEASRNQGLVEFGCTEFMPDEATARRYDEKYFEPVFETGTLMPATQTGDLVRFEPLVFEVTFDGQAPCLLLFHDVAGEVLADRGSRAQAASFVRRADGVIFLVDPMSFREFRSAFKDTPDAALRRPNQANLLSACIADLTPADRARVPFAITLSKSDLVASVMPRQGYIFARHRAADTHEWDIEMKLVEKEVRQLLERLRVRDLLAVTSSLTKVTFHAVSPLGRPPLPDGTLAGPPEPIRCLEPLLAVLSRIPRIFGA